MRVMILASQTDHCLADLIWRWRQGELPMDIAAVVSNHPAATFPHTDLQGIAFHHLPVTPETKPAQEAALLTLIEETGDRTGGARALHADPVGRAVARLEGRCINIHHSFLPGFKGAKPYHQAHGRGVKLIGATAHYVTADLDEGPIIAQDVERDQPPRHARGPGPQGPRHRAPRAGPGRALHRGPGAAERPQDRGVHGLVLGELFQPVLQQLPSMLVARQVHEAVPEHREQHVIEPRTAPAG